MPVGNDPVVVNPTSAPFARPCPDQLMTVGVLAVCVPDCDPVVSIAVPPDVSDNLKVFKAEFTT
jgi:hypothetical protein